MRRIAAIGAIAALLIATAPGAIAEPDVPPPPPPPAAAPPAGSTSIPLTDLGASNAVSFFINRDTAISSLTFPVPNGMTPVELRARLEVPVNLRFANLSVTQGDRTINRQLLPTEDQAEVVIPLNGLQVFDNWITLNFTMSAVPLVDYCWDPSYPIRLVNGSVSFTGVESVPSTVATFLPPVLRKVTIAIPDKPSAAESTAAVQVAAAVANRAGQQPELAVVPLPPGGDRLPAPAAPAERQIIVKEGPDKGLSLQTGPGIPALRVSGPAGDLAAQVNLLSEDSLRYAVSSTATAETLPEQKFVSDSTTLGDLNGSPVTSEALWPRVSVPIDQTRWGHPVGGTSVHLIGSYTPLNRDFGGEVTVSVDREVLDRWPAEDSGVIDRMITIPDSLLTRSTNLEVGIRSTGNPGRCGDHLPVLLRIDPKTTITVEPANPPVPQGFQSVPQALMPRIRIGIGDDTFGDTARAVQIITGLQRASAVPLVTDVIPLQQAITGTDPALLISAGGWDDTTIPLPFSAQQGKVTVSGVNDRGDSIELNLDPAKGFASLQPVYDGQRTVLVATSTGGPGQLDELLRYLAAQPGRWSGLEGRALLSTPGFPPITVPNPPVEYSAPAAAEASQGGDWFWWAVGGVAVLAALGALAILLRARRTEPPALP